MNEPAVIIRLEGNGRAYQPGKELAGRWWAQGLRADEVKAVELSVLWYTEGKGDQDLAVHHFQRFDTEQQPLDPRRPQAFRCRLPASPLSYDGQLVKIRWCVRVRVFVARGKDLFAEQRFRLGRIGEPGGPPVPERFSSPWAAPAHRGAAPQ